MGKFIINGGKMLSGEIAVSGSKNAALPIIFSSLLTDGTTHISNAPDIGDTEVALGILREFGAKTELNGDTVTIDTSDIEYARPSDALVSKIRASTYLIGAELARFGKAEIMRFGGCNFDSRPIDMHIYAAMRLGASFDGTVLVAERLRGADIYFDKISVGATVNAIIMATAAEGTTRIFGYAKEPHVIALTEFFKSSGVHISVCSECIIVNGKRPDPTSHTVIPDMIEAGTYTALSLLTGSKIKILGKDLMHQLESFIVPLVMAGAIVEHDEATLTVFGELCEPLNIFTAPYPNYPTDLHPQMVPLLAAFVGGQITEGVWRNRFGYLAELAKFGIEYEQLDNTAKIKKSKIHAASATAPDLRGGAALLLSALYADGESVIDGAEIIKRGYASIVEKLVKIGADIIEI